MPAGSSAARRSAPATSGRSRSTARGTGTALPRPRAAALTSRVDQSPYAVSKSPRRSVRRPSTSMAVCRSARPVVLAPTTAPPSGSCQGRPVGRRTERRGDFDTAYGDWSTLEVSAAARGRGSAVPVPRAVERLRPEVAGALRRAADDPAGISDAEALTLFDALPGAELDALAALADNVRRDAVGDEVTYVVNRNINFTNVCYTGCRFCAFAQRRTDADAYTLSLAEVGERAEAAWDVGATEVCLQGGIHPDLPGSAYFEIAAEIKRRAPDLHVHAFSPMEIVNGATRTGLSVRVAPL